MDRDGGEERREDGRVGMEMRKCWWQEVGRSMRNKETVSCDCDKALSC